MYGYGVGDITYYVLLGDCGTEYTFTYLVFTTGNITKDLKDGRNGVGRFQKIGTTRVGIRTIYGRGRVTFFGI